MKYLFVSFLVLASMSLTAQEAEIETGKYLYRTFEKGEYELKYRILYPPDFSADNLYPFVIFLHGRGECGDDNEKQLTHGGKLFLDSIAEYPAVVIFPQCPTWDYWGDVSRPSSGTNRRFTFYGDEEPNVSLGLVMELSGEFLKKPFIDTSRFYVIGLSMGGFGAFELLWRMPGKIAAATPICGGGLKEKAALIGDTPIWIFHGVKDDVVNPRYSIRMLYGIQRARGRAKISLYPDANHNAWDPALSEPDYLKWMFSKSKK